MSSTYKRFGLLPFYKSNQDRDWQLEGYYTNWVLSLKYVPRDVLVSFRTPMINGVYSAPVNMKLRKLRIVADLYEVVSEQTVTSGLVMETEGVQSYYYRQQGVFTSDSDDYLTKGCIYDIYIIDSNDNEFISDIFVAIDETELYVYSESGEAILSESREEIIFE